MAVNKVVYGNTTLMDITDSTVDENNLLAGEVAYKRNGQRVVGALNPVGNLALDDLTDVVITNPTIDQGITFDGTYWVNYGAKIILTYDDEFRGQTITCTQGQTVITKTAPSSGNSVTLYVPTTGNWTISAEYEGDTFYSDPNPVNIIALGTAEMAHISAITIPEGSTVLPTDDIQTWLKCANITDKSYTTLAEVLADRETFETLIADSNACDYMVRSTSWAEIKVPTMTDNTHPSGEAFSYYENSNYPAYQAFDSDDTTQCGYTSHSPYTDCGTGYDFGVPIYLNAYKIYTSLSARLLTAVLKGSNDKETWVTLDTYTFSSSNNQRKNINIDTPYRYYCVFLGSLASGYTSTQVGIETIQFYGGVVNNQDAMSLIGKYDYCSNALLSNATWCEAIANSDYWDKVLQPLVPTMTSNTTPSGECIRSSVYSSTYEAWKAFDGTSINQEDAWVTANNSASNSYIGYHFTQSVRVNKLYIKNRVLDNSYSPSTFKFQGYNGSEWIDIDNVFTISNPTAVGAENTFIIHNDNFYEQYRIYTLTASGTVATIGNMQFYGRASSNVSNTNGIIHTANGDTVTCNGNTYVADTNGIIDIDFSQFDEGTYTFTSGIAKDPTNLSNYYSKSFKITKSPYGGTTELYLMPDTVKTLYWYGNESDGIEDLSTANGWSGTFTAPSHNTNDITTTSTGSVYNGVGSKTPLNMTKLVAIVQGLASSGNGGDMMTTIAKNFNYVDYSAIPIGQAFTKELSVSNNNMYFSMYGYNNRNLKISAIWYE